LDLPKFKRLPKHIGVIPDGNRRWAAGQGLHKEDGYTHGINPGFQLYELCVALGIEEMTFYGFTNDNTKRPVEQRLAFQKACVDAVNILSNRDAALLVVGNDASPMFPTELKPYTKRQVFGRNLMKINFLVNYDWHWDISHALRADNPTRGESRKKLMDSIASTEVSRIDLIIRWGGRRRLSGLLPVQAVYADFYVLDELWPDFCPDHFFNALRWYEEQDITLGG
jgi:undecaprenyl diphosphate synthase